MGLTVMMLIFLGKYEPYWKMQKKKLFWGEISIQFLIIEVGQ